MQELFLRQLKQMDLDDPQIRMAATEHVRWTTITRYVVVVVVVVVGVVFVVCWVSLLLVWWHRWSIHSLCCFRRPKINSDLSTRFRLLA